MIGPRHPFGSVKEAAAGLHRAAGAAGVSLHPLPFNRFSRDDTDWWLSPEPGNPAYRYAKIAITAGPSAAPGDLFVGLSFEKSIGPSAAGFSELNRADMERFCQESGTAARWQERGVGRRDGQVATASGHSDIRGLGPHGSGAPRVASH